MHHEMARLQVTVGMLHAYHDVVGNGEKAKAPQVQQHISTLCTRLPSLQSALKESDTSSPCGLVSDARQKLNDLQDQINTKRKEDAHAGQKKE